MGFTTISCEVFTMEITNIEDKNFNMKSTTADEKLQ
jgi:hypothetical protein